MLLKLTKLTTRPNQNGYFCTLPSGVCCFDILIMVVSQHLLAFSGRTSSLKNQKIPGWIILTEGGAGGPIAGIDFQGQKFLWPLVAPVVASVGRPGSRAIDKVKGLLRKGVKASLDTSGQGVEKAADSRGET